jgi:hypothetical protein
MPNPGVANSFLIVGDPLLTCPGCAWTSALLDGETALFGILRTRLCPVCRGHLLLHALAVTNVETVDAERIPGPASG